VGVGVLDDVLYAVGGYDESINEYYNIVEAYRSSTGVWTSIPNMHLCRSNAGITTCLIILNYYIKQKTF